MAQSNSRVYEKESFVQPSNILSTDKGFPHLSRVERSFKYCGITVTYYAYILKFCSRALYKTTTDALPEVVRRRNSGPKGLGEDALPGVR